MHDSFLFSIISDITSHVISYDILPVDEHECVSLGDVKSLHRGKLMRPRCISYLKGTDVLVTADDLPIRIFDGRDIRVFKGV